MNKIILTVLLAATFQVFGYRTAKAENEQTTTLKSRQLSVVLDNQFPRVLEYRLEQKKMTGAVSAEKQVLINGKKAQYKVVFRQEGEAKAVYDFTFPELGLAFACELSVDGQMLQGKITNILEGETKLYTLAFPAHQLLSVTEQDKAPAYIWCRMIPMVDSPDVYTELKNARPQPQPSTANYVFLENGELAAGILSNVIDERERVAWHMQQGDSGKTGSIWCPVWTYRELDSETLENPWFKVLIAADENQDKTVNWQDAAILYRRQVSKPYRAAEVKKIVSSQIGFNASHFANNPFLRMFDNMKKCALLIDFLPQDLLVKGYQGGGHDSSVPDYAHPNIQAGGFKDLNYMIDNGKKINLNVGLHINCTEAYPESRYFDPAILTKELGWLWGDQSVLIDKKKDLKSGKLFQRIDEMFDSIPHIDFLYVDTYQDRGWPLIKIREKLESYNQRMYTEFDVAMDGVSTWSHGRVRLKDKMARFIWNDCRDIFWMDPLLFGADHHGINGWEGEGDVRRFVREVFTENLPSKFLQHFQLMKWTDTEALFDKGVKTVRHGDHVTGTWEKATFFEGDWNEKNRSFSQVSLFIPWEPDMKIPERIFMWDDAGTDRNWILPASWKVFSKVYVYELTDRGRQFKAVVLVKRGTVNYKAEKGKPYVVYSRKMEEIQPGKMAWGEGQEVADPGFNDYLLAAWKREGHKEAVKVAVTPNGQTSLEISSVKSAGVSQKLQTLIPGVAYYVSANVFIPSGKLRQTTLSVGALKKGKMLSESRNHLDRTTLNGVSGWQRLRVLFQMPEDADQAEIVLLAGECAGETPVWVDDVRAYRTVSGSVDTGSVLFEDFELRDVGWGPFVNTVKGSVYTDLSEFNPGRTADVIDGDFSLKTWNHKKGLLYRTTPGLLRLRPQTRFEISFDYLCDRDDSYELIVKESDAPDAKVLLRFPIKRGKGRISEMFTTTAFEDSWIGIEKTNDDLVIFVMDNLKIFFKE